MFSDFPEECMTLGSGRRFLQIAADRICTPSSYVLVHPARICVEPVMHLIKEELDSRHRQVIEIDATEIDAMKLPKSFCAASKIELNGSEARSFDRIQDRLVNVDVVYLFGFQAAGRADTKRWLEFINQWSANVKRRIDQGLHATILVASMQLEPAMIDSLSVDTTMHVAWWWGIPSRLELQLVCRGVSMVADDSIKSQWQEHLAVALASGDQQFLETIWSSLTGTICDLVRLMKDYAKQRGWTTELIKRGLSEYSPGFAPHVWAINKEQQSLEPPKHLRQAWSDGLLFFSLEYGCELHAAAACLLDEKGAHAMIWRAQLGLLSPQLDLARSMMCQVLTNKLGKDWPVRYDKPKDDRELKEVIEDPLCCQLGYLSHLLQKHGSYQRVNSTFRILSKLASDLRNDLSHLRPIDYTRYRAFHYAMRDAVG